jgi:hypothetical protein
MVNLFTDPDLTRPFLWKSGNGSGMPSNGGIRRTRNTAFKFTKFELCFLVEDTFLLLYFLHLIIPVTFVIRQYYAYPHCRSTVIKTNGGIMFKIRIGIRTPGGGGAEIAAKAVAKVHCSKK